MTLQVIHSMDHLIHVVLCFHNSVFTAHVIKPSTFYALSIRSPNGEVHANHCSMVELMASAEQRPDYFVIPASAAAKPVLISELFWW